MKRILHLCVSMLLLVLKILVVLKSLFGSFFVVFVFKPLRRVLSIFFHKLFIKFYSRYLSILKKIGLNRRHGEGHYFRYFLNKKLAHFILIFLSVVVIFTNVTSDSEAYNPGGETEKTILSDLISSEFDEFTEDERLIVETFDSEVMISDLQQSYLDNLSSFRAQPRVNYGEVAEDEENQDLPTIQDGSSIVRQDQVGTKISKRPREGRVEYVVQPGDTISTIAEKFEISVSTILWENNLGAYSIIRPGDKLGILQANGIMHTVGKGEGISFIANKYKIDEAKIIEFNKLGNDGKLAAGQRLLIPDGRKIESEYKPKTYSGYSGLSVLKNIIDRGNAPQGASPVTGNKMNWPTVGRRITQYYSWRHTGLDVANKVGTPLYAADSGVVTVAGWGSGYGNQIVIDHGGGKQTRYAHCSKFYVKKGDRVAKGETIAAMGSTGWSTGSHIHFEVIINGRKYNPLNYIK